MDLEWTYADVRREVIKSLEIEGRRSVSLDVSRDTAMNVRRIVSWCRAMGYDASSENADETVVVSRKGPPRIPGAPRTKT